MSETVPPHRRRRRGASPLPAFPPPDEVLLEILHCLPPDPSCLPRLSLVCKHWRRLVSDPLFHRRFHSHHHRAPPLLGFFHNSFHLPCFVAAGDPPDRVPAEAFSLRRHPGRWLFLGCRHGRALLASPFSAWSLLMVWDPLTGHRSDVPVPSTFHQRYFRGAALLCDAGDCHRPTPFRVVFAFVDQDRRASACVYSSQSGAWGELVSAEGGIPADMHLQYRALDDIISGEQLSGIDMKPPVLVGNVLYWLLSSICILQFNLDTKRLTVINGPDGMDFLSESWSVQIMPAEGGSKLGLAAVSMLYLHLWVRKIGFNGVEQWVLGRIVQLDMYLPLKAPITVEPHLGSMSRFGLLGFTEDGGVIFLQTTDGVFMVQLDVMKFKMVLPREILHAVYPYSGFYLTDGCVGNDYLTSEVGDGPNNGTKV